MVKLLLNSLIHTQNSPETKRKESNELYHGEQTMIHIFQKLESFGPFFQVSAISIFAIRTNRRQYIAVK